MADQLMLAPLRTDRPGFGWRSRIDDAFYRFELHWITRKRGWFLSILRDDGTALASGISLVTGTDLLAPFGSADFPPGQLFVEDTSGQQRNAGRHDLRGEHRLIYRPAADIAGHVGTDTEIL